MILVVVVYWLTSTAYVIHYHFKNGEKAFGVVLMALLLGPILAIIIKDEKRKSEEENITEHIENDRHRRWFRTMGEINRQRIPNWGRTIPPPPPISPPPNRRPNKITKDFKFFQK